MKATCSKRYDDLPFAHRQPLHQGHCAYVHGHNWSVEFEFSGVRDELGFVIDFGKLKWLKAWLEGMFDHTTLINKDDPELQYFVKDAVDHTTECRLITVGEFEPQGIPDTTRSLYDLRIVDDCSCEGLALLIFARINKQLRERTAKRKQGEVTCIKVTLWEDSKNKAIVTG